MSGDNGRRAFTVTLDGRTSTVHARHARAAALLAMAADLDRSGENLDLWEAEVTVDGENFYVTITNEPPEER